MCFEHLLDPTRKEKSQTQERPKMRKGTLKELLDVRFEEEGGAVFEATLEGRTIIETDFDGLNEALSNYPGDLALWFMLEQKAKARVTRLETDLEYKEAELYLEAPKFLESMNKKPTVDAIKAWVTLHDERVELVEKIVEAKAIRDRIVAGRITLQARQSNMLALGSNLRAEMEMKRTIRTDDARERMRKAIDKPKRR